jgi:hypothetical protein
MCWQCCVAVTARHTPTQRHTRYSHPYRMLYLTHSLSACFTGRKGDGGPLQPKRRVCASVSRRSWSLSPRPYASSPSRSPCTSEFPARASFPAPSPFFCVDGVSCLSVVCVCCFWPSMEREASDCQPHELEHENRLRWFGSSRFKSCIESTCGDYHVRARGRRGARGWCNRVGP